MLILVLETTVFIFFSCFIFNLTGSMDIEERNRQMKMSKYKQVAGSDSRLEQDYHSKAREFCFEKQQNMLNIPFRK